MLTAKLLLVVLVRAELPEDTTGIAMPPAWNISHLPVVPIQSKVHGRGLAARRDTAIGELLFVDKAWLLGTNDQLLNSAFATLDDCDELQKHRFLSLFDGQHAAPVVDELLPGRVARSQRRGVGRGGRVDFRSHGEPLLQAQRELHLPGRRADLPRHPGVEGGG
eukprot:g13820.t1